MQSADWSVSGSNLFFTHLSFKMDVEILPTSENLLDKDEFNNMDTFFSADM
jgi:hypothetical protein